jgi:hypothetical protein
MHVYLTYREITGGEESIQVIHGKVKTEWPKAVVRMDLQCNTQDRRQDQQLGQFLLKTNAKRMAWSLLSRGWLSNWQQKKMARGHRTQVTQGVTKGQRDNNAMEQTS